MRRSPLKSSGKRLAALALALTTACGGAHEGAGTTPPATARTATPRWESFGPAAFDRARAEQATGLTDANDESLALFRDSLTAFQERGSEAVREAFAADPNRGHRLENGSKAGKSFAKPE